MNPKSYLSVPAITAILILLSSIPVGCYSGSYGTQQLARIAFITQNNARPCDYIVVTINEDGSDFRELGPWYYSTRADLPQCWSANGKRLVYTQGFWEDAEKWLAVFDADGSNQSRLLEITKMNINGLSISPDGKTVLLAYQELSDVYRAGETYLEPHTMHDIMTVDIDSGTMTLLTNFTDIDASSPVFSPDGKQIAFTGRTDDPETHFDLYVMNADGTEVKRMAQHHGVLPYLESGLQWSPDNRKVLFSLVTSFDDSAGYNDLLLIDVTTGIEVNLTNTDNISENEPRWSPDGQKIAFTQLRGKYQVPFATVMNVQESNLKTVAKWLTYASWLPDSQRLIGIERTEESTWAIVTIDIDGNNTEILLPVSNLSDNYSGISYPLYLGY